MAPSTTTMTTNEAINDVLKDQSKLNLDSTEENFDPVTNFLIALKAPETKRLVWYDHYCNGRTPNACHAVGD